MKYKKIFSYLVGTQKTPPLRAHTLPVFFYHRIVRKITFKTHNAQGKAVKGLRTPATILFLSILLEAIPPQIFMVYQEIYESVLKINDSGILDNRTYSFWILVKRYKMDN